MSHMHVRARRRLQDALTAIRHGVTLAQAGARLYPNGERHLRDRSRLARLYPPQLLAQTLQIAQRCTFSLDELRYEYPRELVPQGETPGHLAAQAGGAGVRRRWPEGAAAGTADHRARTGAHRAAGLRGVFPDGV